jgi:hypothetical protein
MKPNTRPLALAALLLLAVGSASAEVTVTFTNTDKYTDMPRFEREKQAMLGQIEKHFKTLAQGLPSGQDLKVDVLDVDLAGRIDPMRMDEIRILRGMADWPRMSLHYSIEAGGKVIASGTDNITDMTYLDHINRYDRGDSLRYEKKMIDDWFKQTVSARQVMGQPSVSSAAVR